MLAREINSHLKRFRKLGFVTNLWDVLKTYDDGTGHYVAVFRCLSNRELACVETPYVREDLIRNGGIHLLRRILRGLQDAEKRGPVQPGELRLTRPQPTANKQPQPA